MHVETEKDLLPLLANTGGSVYNPKSSPAYSCSTTLVSPDGETSSMGRVFTTLQRLLDGCLEALTSRFARWTKPLRTSLPLSTLTDLSRSKSELIAENALLRHQLIVQPDTRLALASGALSSGLEAQVKNCFSYTEGRPRNHRVDQANGAGKSTLGS